MSFPVNPCKIIHYMKLTCKTVFQYKINSCLDILFVSILRVYSKIVIFFKFREKLELINTKVKSGEVSKGKSLFEVTEGPRDTTF